MNLNSRIAQWLSDVFSNHRNFIFAITIDGIRGVYYLDVRDHQTMKLISRIGVDVYTIESDDLEEFIKVVEPCLPFTITNLTDDQIENIQDEAVHKSNAELWDELE